MTTGGINAGELLGDVLVAGVAIKMIDTMVNNQPVTQKKMQPQNSRTHLQHHMKHSSTKLQRKLYNTDNPTPF
jgi:hypothetical protein